MIVAPFAIAADGIAREAALLQSGRPALLLWQSEEEALVLPAALARHTALRASLRELQEAGVSVLTRSSGGGIVPQGPGTLNLAVVLPCRPDFTLQDGYRLICGAVEEALTRFDISAQTGACPGSFCDGAWNVLVEGRKLAGTAQRWRAMPGGHVALLHAAILQRQPDTRQWSALARLHDSLPEATQLRREAHTSLDRLMPPAMSKNSFPGALIRAAEDRLSAWAPREEEAA